MQKLNQRERLVYEELIEQGYEVHHKGFPDFLAYHPEKEELMFVEVKTEPTEWTETAGLTVSQYRVCEILHKFHEVLIKYLP